MRVGCRGRRLSCGGVGWRDLHETSAEREAAHVLTVTQLDQAATAATMLAQVIQGSGDKFAMMAYGREVQQLLPPGAGVAHVRLLIDLLSQTRSEAAEADHLNAVARLKSAQRRRGLIVWITELVDSVGKPELVVAAVGVGAEASGGVGGAEASGAGGVGGAGAEDEG